MNFQLKGIYSEGDSGRPECEPLDQVTAPELRVSLGPFRMDDQSRAFPGVPLRRRRMVSQRALLAALLYLRSRVCPWQS